MSNRTSHRRQARRLRNLEVRAKVTLMTDIPNWEHMDMAELSAILDERNGK